MPLPLFIAVLVAFLLINAAIATATVRLIAGVFRSPVPTWRRALVFFAVSLTLGLSLLALDTLGPLFILLGTAVSIAAIPTVFAKVFRLGWYKSFGAVVVTNVIQFAIALGIALLFRAFVVESFRTPTMSMAPTIDPQMRFLADKTLRTPDRWDVVVFRSTEVPPQVYVKRVIGLPGERVQLVEGRILINGTEILPPLKLSTPAFRDGLTHIRGMPGTLQIPAEQLGADEYFVIGDNTTASLDSRRFVIPNQKTMSMGLIPRERVIGVVRTIYWPPAEAMLLR